MTHIDPAQGPGEHSTEGPAQAAVHAAPVGPYAEALALLLRHSRLVFGFPVSLGVLAFLYFQFFGSYAAVSSFTPEQTGMGLTSLAGLAAQFGVNIPAGMQGKDRPLDFYVAVLQSPQLLADVVQSEFRFAKTPGGADSVRGTLVQLYGAAGDTPEERVQLAVKQLQTRIAVSSERLAGIISIRTKAPWRELAQRINRRMLDLLNQFNVDKRQFQAVAERRFVEERLAGARSELAAAEDSVQRFLEQNRTFQTSPRLTFEAARLQRRVDLRQQVYTTLAQSYEQARIEEVRNTPMITIIQRPELFSGRARSRLRMAFLALIFGLGMSASVVLFREYLIQTLQSNAESSRRVVESIPRFWWRVLPLRWAPPRST